MSTLTATEVLSPATQQYAMREVRSATAPEWNAWLEDSPGGGHYFQTHEWGEFKRNLSWEPVRLVLERDGEPAGVAQFLLYDTPFVPGKLMYCPRGPWIPWDDAEAVSTFFGGVRTVAECHGVHTVKIEPEVLESQTDVKALLSRIGFRKSRWDLQYKTTMIIDLSPTEEEILASMKGKTRYNIRLAAKKGVQVVQDNSPAAQDALYELVRVTAERDNFFTRQRGYMQSVWRLMFDTGRANLFFATHDGERLAAFLAYTFGGKLWYAVGASTNEGRNLMPTYLLQWEVMRWAKTRGISVYDMVAIPNPENLCEDDPMYGLYRFKAGFGGEIADFLGCLDWRIRPVPATTWYNLEPVYYRAYQKLKRDVYY